MVAGKVKAAMGFQRSPSTPRSEGSRRFFCSSPSSHKASPAPAPAPPSSKTIFSRSFGVYFPRSSQVQPRPPDVAELVRLVEEVQEKESRLQTELLEQKLLKETVAIVPFLEKEICSKNAEIENSKARIRSLEAENEELRSEVERIRREGMESERVMKQMENENAELRKAVAERKGEGSKRFLREAVECEKMDTESGNRSADC